MNKLFIIGLPRTGTTSISVTLLDYGFKVAHTAYTKRAFELAEVISDAPCFCDYQELDALFPNSKFVYLERDLNLWIPSMRMLLTKMLPELTPKTGYLNPQLKRCITTSFNLANTENPLSDAHLSMSYREHQTAVLRYFSGRTDLLSINISTPGSLKNLLTFLAVHDEYANNFPHLNMGKQVDHWQQLKHPNKINSLSAGKDHRQFFDYPKMTKCNKSQ